MGGEPARDPPVNSLRGVFHLQKAEADVALGRTPVYKKKMFGVKEKKKKKREKEKHKHRRQRRQSHRIPVEIMCDRWQLR